MDLTKENEMPLKEAKGNMYDWVTHMHTHLGGECPHKCVYCYVGKNRWGRAPRYTGKLQLINYEFKVNYKTGKIIFIEHMNDMFAEEINGDWIRFIFNHCNEYNNEYVFQTKNPVRAYRWKDFFPKKSMIGTTIESNKIHPGVSNAPSPADRINGIKNFKDEGFKTFITIEPILDFDIDIFSSWIIDAAPDFVNIGADSKRCGLPEPSREKVMELAECLQKAGVTIRKKVNLERLIA